MPFLLTVRLAADDGHQTPIRQARVTAYALKQPVVLKSDGSQIVHQPETALTNDTGHATLTLYRGSEVLTPSDWAVTIDGVTWSGPVPESPGTASSILEMVESHGWGIIAAPKSVPVVAVTGPSGTAGPTGPTGPAIDGLSSDLAHGIDVVGAGTFGGGVRVPDDAFGSFIAGLDGLVLGVGSPTWTSGVDDVTGPDSYWGANYCVHFIDWTPTESGFIAWPYPVFDPNTQQVAFTLWPADGGPTLDVYPDASQIIKSQANMPDLINPGPSVSNIGSETITAGTAYRIAVSLAPLNSDNSNPPPTGVTVDLTRLIQATQFFGGQASPLTVTRASGVDADAHGWATANGDYCKAVGERVTASLEGSQAFGVDTQAHGFASSARGNGCVAIGDRACAEGTESIAQGPDAHAEGFRGRAVGAASHAEGDGTLTIGGSSHAEGTNTIARGADSHVEGQSSEANGAQSHAQNHGSIADADYSTAIGHRSHTTNRAQVAMATDRFDNTEGTAQYSTLTPLISTTNATPTPLSLGADRVDLPTNQTWQVIVQVTGSRKDAPGTVAGWVIRGLATNVGGTLRLVGALDTINWHDAGAAAWVATLDVSAGHLDVLVTGVAAQTIYWHAAIHASQVGV